MPLKIVVRPLAAGWTVSTDATDNQMVFLSGRKAEAAARDLALKLSGSGQAADIEIWTRDGRLAGRITCPPAPRDMSLAG